METDQLDSVLLSPCTGARQPELMLCTVLHLMSHYTERSAESGACLKLASVIERHLKALAGRSDLSPVLQATCQQLSEQWASVVESAMPRPPESSFFSRIMARRASAAMAYPAGA